MRIQFKRSGGFVPTALTLDLDADSLPPAEAKELADLVEASRFFDLPRSVAPPARGADRFLYELTVESAGRRHTVRAGDASVPEGLQPLLRRLTEMARAGRAGAAPPEKPGPGPQGPGG